MSLALRQTPTPQQEADAFEDARLAALDRFDVLDTPREDGFDGIVRLIRNIFDVPVGIVSVIDAHRQWYKACEGLAQTEAARKDTFCDITIRSAGPLVVEDALKDPRFAANPYVAGEPHIRFYAGVPLVTRDGHAIGTLCAVGMEPRGFGREQLEILTDLARVAMAELELRQHVKIDTRTGMLSRRAFLEEGDDAIALARRHEMELSCIAIGVEGAQDDGALSDRALAAVAALLRRNLRRTDIIGRAGADRFAVVLPNTGGRGAFDVSQKLRAAFRALAIDDNGAEVRVAASIGAASLDSDVDDLEDLLARAEAMHAEARIVGNSHASWSQPAAREVPARRRVLKAGTIHFNNRGSTVDCTIRSLSSDGAGLDLSHSFGLPERFGLMIRADGVDRPCRIQSQTERHVEVEFV